MNKSLLVGLIAGAGAATAVGAVANYAHERSIAETSLHAAPTAESRGTVVRHESTAPAVVAAEPARGRMTGTVAVGTTAATGSARDAAPVRARFAEVVDVQPITKTVEESREVCTDVPVTEQAPVKDERRVAGTLAGAVIGGLLGSQVGDGKGRKIATVAGAAAGGYAGNRVQDRVQKSNTVTTTERQCQTVTEPHEQTIAYDVTYAYEGETRTVRMNHEPGRRLPAREGRVVLTADAR